MKRYYLSLDFLRGIAITLMIIGHSIIVYPIDISGNTACQIIHNFIYYFHMEFFFILAGMCESKKRYLDVVKKKSKRLLIPYFFFGIMSIILHSYSNLVNGNEGIVSGLERLFFRGGDYWFLYVLFEISLLAPILLLIKEKAKVVYLVIIVVLLLLSGRITNEFLCINYVLNYLPYFMLGNLLNDIGVCEKAEKAYEKKIINKCLVVLIGAVLGTVCFVFYQNNYVNVFLHFIGVFAWFIAALFMISFVKNKEKILAKYMFLAGKYSLQMYLFNGYLMVLARELIVTFCGVSNPYVIMLFITLSNCLGALLIVELVIKKVKLFSGLCGIMERNIS
ncbi:MAG: acyltransferase [Lachnospiraceae bacterium]|nr:acyltransferase [Lachnospiraceae bacterium]